MCGIAAIISSRKSDSHLRELQTMNHAIEHRGPDDFGYFVCAVAPPADDPKVIYRKTQSTDAPAFVGLGHRRLSIIDLSSHGHQPMSFQNERYWITYNGEIYNYLEIRAELEALGHTFYTQSDTEVILAAYAQWQSECLSRFNGMWAFVLIDLKTNRFFAARDRFGVKPLYFSSSNGTTYFASEIKQLTQLNLHNGKSNPQAIAQFIAVGRSIPSSATFFSGISCLEGGQFLEGDLDHHESSLQPKVFYSLRSAVKDPAPKRTFPDFVIEFGRLFKSAVQLRMRSDTPVGSCLSGGLDSSAIVAAMAELKRKARIEQDAASESIKTFSATFPGTQHDESKFAERVAEDAGADWIPIKPNLDNVWEELDKFIWHHDEPFRSLSVYAQWCVMRQVQSAGIKVVLDGQGADEVLLGYHGDIPRLFATLLAQRRFSTCLNLWKQMRKTGIFAATDSSFKMIGKIVFYLFVDRIANPSCATSDLLVQQFKALVHQSHESGRDLRNLQISEFSAALQDLLRFEDRNSMAFGIEARTPFLDYRLVEFALGVPIETCYQNGWTKSLLRHAVSPILTDEVTWRTDKKGFATPEFEWYRHAKPEFQRRLVDRDSRIHRYISKDNVAKIIASMPSDRHGYLPWRLLCLDRWMEVFNIQD